MIPVPIDLIFLVLVTWGVGFATGWWVFHASPAARRYNKLRYNQEIYEQSSQHPDQTNA